MMRAGLALLVASGAFLTLLLFFAGEVYEYQDSFDGARLPQVDAIVCLAGGRGRLAMAGDLWYRYWEKAHGSEKIKTESIVPTLYFSGTGKNTQWPELSKQIRRGVVEVVTPRDVVIEDESRNTEENAIWFARYARQHQWKKILLVTSSYHMKRARLIFEVTLKHQGIATQIDTASVFQDPFEPGEWLQSFHGVRITINEYLKFLWFRMSAGQTS